MSLAVAVAYAVQSFGWLVFARHDFQLVKIHHGKYSLIFQKEDLYFIDSHRHNLIL